MMRMEDEGMMLLHARNEVLMDAIFLSIRFLRD